MFFCSQKIKGLLTYLLVLANNYGLLCTTKVLDTKLYLSRVDNRQLPNCMYMIFNLIELTSEKTCGCFSNCVHTA